MPAVMPAAMDDLLLPLADLAAAPRPRALVGGKAASLARLIAAGVPVPEGLVLTTRVAELPADQQDAVLQALVQRARSLGELLAVRSSATIEDGVAAAAPGIFVSRLHVDTAALPHAPHALIDAVREVWASAHAPLVQAYARARGLDHARMAVIVQAQVSGHAAGVAYTRPPGHPNAPEMLIETHAGEQNPARSIRIPRATEAPAPGSLPLNASTLAELVRVLGQTEAALAAPGGADVEWVAGPAGVWIVQARPIVHPPAAPAPAFPEALIRFSRARPELVWRWDVSHNPDPLSPAQAGLVERMDRAGLVPYRMRVVGGYLYVASPPEPAPEAPKAPAEAPSETAHDSAEALRRRFEDTWRPALEAALAAAAEAAEDAAGLPRVLEAYERFYAVYAGALTERVARARRALPGFLRERGFDAPEPLTGALLEDRSPARLETLIARVASDQASFDELLAVAGPMSPAWDVAVPTLAESPEVLRRAVAAAASLEPRARAAGDRVRAGLAPGDHDAFARCLALARSARDIGELDDRLYARAQAAVRHALLRLARHWDLADPEDIFFLPLDLVTARAGEPGRPDAAALHRMARAGRAARERQRAWIMPLAFANGQAIEPPAHAAASDHDTWRGRGTGGRARGTAVRIADLGDIVTHQAPDLAPDAILVVLAITPAMAVLLPHAVAVVAQHGGLLGHGAAMARELGLPCVVDCARAWQDLRTGDPLWLDGEAGLVVRAGR